MKYFTKNFRVYARENRIQSTLAERKIWSIIRKKQILGYQFKRQVTINKYIVDFYCHRLKLCIEIDGSSHDENRYSYDVERQTYLKSLGCKFLRFTESDVRNNVENIKETIWMTVRELSS